MEKPADPARSAGELPPASPWVRRFAGLIRPGGTVLDVAAGRGRHTALFLAAGHPVVAVDRDVTRLRNGLHDERLTIVEADLENAPWPFGADKFAGIVVTNYLHRPLLPALADALEPGGVLIYETFAAGNEEFGKPSNPHFLLRRGELLDAFAGTLEVVAFEDTRTDVPRPAVVQRICAVNRGGPPD
jgi:SAM-dependent methyltransferase